jgi:hypothetical protein
MLGSAFFAVARAQAQIGDDFQALVARWGQPENPLSLIMGLGQWDLKNGAQVSALLMDGRTQLVMWQRIDAKLYDTLLNRNLPPDTTWVDGKDAKDWIRKNVPNGANANFDAVPGVMVKQTSDGKLWCIYGPDNFLLCTPQGFERFAKLGQLLNNTEKEP